VEKYAAARQDTHGNVAPKRLTVTLYTLAGHQDGSAMEM